MSKKTIAQGLAAEAVRTNAVQRAKQPRRRPTRQTTTSTTRPRRTLRDPLGINEALR